ncbi:probable polygalacturonase At1g80170 [Elaeis guineensis]|uniref:endo-polygalacturonase n=1 Tax=Elaeis guineensis var. tenera TaxID=51953 RepID=A0A6I9R7N6_ELAGV|nr:probable polygalacturonase At1g80170 [Elaeis guineensis]
MMMEMVDGCRRKRSSPSIAVMLFLLLLVCCSSSPSQVLSPLIIRQLPRSSSSNSTGAAVLVSVDDFGAKGDGCTDDTKAFKDAWEFACLSPLRTILQIPAENVYLVRPVDFAGPCKAKLTMLVSGTIIAPSDPDIWQGLDPHKWLYFHGIRQLVLGGGGTINGMGQEWWARSCKRNATNPCRHAPTAVTFHRSKHLTIHDLTLMNSQQMHMAFTTCSHVRASRLKVVAPAESPNTDGIHISASVSVVVADTMIRTGDDCISIVSNSSDILVKNIVCGPGHGISIGSLGKSATYAQVHNVRVDGCLITNAENGARIKTWQGGRGYARKIVFQNIWMKNVSNPIIIDQYYCDSSHPCKNQTSAVKVDEISFIDIKGTSATEHAIKFACSDTFPCVKIFLKDINFSLESGGNATAYCWKASGFTSGLVYPPSCLSSSDQHMNHVIKQSVNSTTGKLDS